MATITLTEDTLISTLMPSGGGTLATGDTIQLAGHSLIVDTDAVATPVTIANSGGDANLELRDLGRIKLNATLPANVHPWIDPAHPLPVSAEPGIDGDPYRTSLTANARAELDLGAFGLGGGKASLPTLSRTGKIYGEIQSFPTTSSIEFKDDLDAHVGDYVYVYGSYQNIARKITAYDSATKTASLDGTIAYRTLPLCCFIMGGGVCVTQSAISNVLFTADMEFGTLTVLNLATSGSGNAKNPVFSNCSATGDVFSCAYSNSIYRRNPSLLDNASANIKAISCQTLGSVNQENSLGSCFLVCDVIGVWSFSSMNAAGSIFAKIGKTIGGAFSWPWQAFSDISVGEQFTPGNMVVPASSTQGKIEVGGVAVEYGGTVSKEEMQGQIPLAYFHAPATASDTTWRYEYRTVKANATLRIRALWKRAENSAATAAVAITDTANWYAGTKGGALAEAVFDSTVGDGWNERVISWRNDGDTDAQVRVWECVTGDTAGGYLRTIEATGGPM